MRINALVGSLVIVGTVGSAFGAGTLPIDAASQSALTDAQKAALNNNEYESVEVSGTGTVLFSGIASYAGDIVVKSGSIVKCTDKTGVGTAAGKTIVESGGSFAYFMTGYARLQNEAFEICGNGVGSRDGVDYGAIYCEVSDEKYSSDSLFGSVTLTGAARVTSPNSNTKGRFSLCSTFNQGGFYLTTKTGEMSLNPSTWTNPASIETQSGYFHWGSVWNTVYKEGCELVWNGGNWSSYSATSLVWPVRMKKSAGFYMGNTTAASDSNNNFKGLFTLESGVTLTLGSWAGTGKVAFLWFSGGLAGAGTLSIENLVKVKVGGEVSGSVLVKLAYNVDLQIDAKMTGAARLSNNSSTGTVYLNGTENDFTGLTTLTGGSIIPIGDGAFPVANTASSETLSITGGRLLITPKFEGETTGFSDANVAAIIDNVNKAKIKNVMIYVPKGREYVYDGELDGSDTLLNTRFCADGKITFTGAMKNDYVVKKNSGAGETVCTGGFERGTMKDHNVCDDFDSGILRLKDGFFMVKGIDWYFGTVARLILEGSANFIAKERIGSGTTTSSSYFPYANEGRVVVELKDDVVVSNKFRIANYTDSIGSVYMRGGVFNHMNGSDTSWASVAGSQGFFELSGGSFDIGYWTRAATQPNSAFCWYQSGGSYKSYTQHIFVLRGTGVVYQVGGTFDYGSNNYMPGNPDWSNCNPGGYINHTVSGTGTVFKNTGYGAVILGVRDQCHHFFNVNDGAVVETDRISRSTTNSEIEVVVGFNGGIVRPGGTTSSFLGINDGALHYGTPVYKLYEKGLTVDTSRAATKEFRLNAELGAPTGKGVKAVALPAQMPDGYIAPPVVTIVGDGFGATAVAEFDSANGVVTGIAVTSPGWGYTTATATLSRGGPKKGQDVLACGPVTLADNVCGGFTKAGAGLVLVNVPSTYTGPTAVKGGTLRLGASNVIAASRSVSVAEGATLDLNNKVDLTLDSISDCYGSVVNGGLVVTNELRFAAADLIAKKTERVGALTLGPDVKIVVDEPANLPIGRYKLLTADSLTVQGILSRPAGFDEPWKVTVKKNSIYLSYPVGMMLLIR